MARPSGVRNPDFDIKRNALLDKLTAYVLSDDVQLPSMRQLAIAAETSQPTLNHYFGDRPGVMVAIIHRLRLMSRPIRRQLRFAERNIEESIAGFVRIAIELASNDTYRRSHAFAIREGMVDEEVLSTYMEEMVEPAIDAIAERIVKTPGGSRNFATARVAARLLYDGANSVVLRCAMSDITPDTAEFERQVTLMHNWFLHGFLRFPDGPDASSSPTDPQPQSR